MTTAVEIVEQALAVAAACDRSDLHRRLRLVRQRIADPRVLVLVVGEAGKGKSSLVNALVGAPVCPVADERRSPVPVLVRHGQQPRAVLVFAAAGTPVDPAGPADGELHTEPVPIERVAGLVAAAGAADGRQVVRAEVELPRQLLGGGLELMDTVGLGGVGTARAGSSLQLVPRADAVLVVTDASQEFTASEMAALQQVAALCPAVAVVVAKTDTAPEWRRIADLDTGHLRRKGIDAPVFPVSAALATLAVSTQDTELYRESALGALSTYLHHDVLNRSGALALRGLLHDVTGVADQLALAVRSELAAREDPAGREELLHDLEAARAAVDELRRNSARWQQLLADGVTDLMTDIDHDLQERARVVLREAEAAIDARDPGPRWPEIAGWLEERVATAVADSYIWAEQRAEWLAQQVLRQFSDDGGGAVPDLSVGSPANVLQSLVDVPDLDAGEQSFRSRLLTGLRGSYSGVLMTGLLTSLAGLSMINPLSLAAGALMGRKVYLDDRDQRILRRQAEAKNLARRYLDEVIFQAGKPLKDRLRIVQRTLRNLITDTVDEMSRSLTEAVKGAQRSATEASAAHEARIRELRMLLDRLDRLTAEAGQIAAAAGAPA